MTQVDNNKRTVKIFSQESKFAENLTQYSESKKEKVRVRLHLDSQSLSDVLVPKNTHVHPAKLPNPRLTDEEKSITSSTEDLQHERQKTLKTVCDKYPHLKRLPSYERMDYVLADTDNHVLYGMIPKVNCRKKSTKVATIACHIAMQLQKQCSCGCQTLGLRGNKISFRLKLTGLNAHAPTGRICRTQKVHARQQHFVLSSCFTFCRQHQPRGSSLWSFTLANSLTWTHPLTRSTTDVKT